VLVVWMKLQYCLSVCCDERFLCFRGECSVLEISFARAEGKMLEKMPKTCDFSSLGKVIDQFMLS